MVLLIGRGEYAIECYMLLTKCLSNKG
jgi:hypothetical protein